MGYTYNRVLAGRVLRQKRCEQLLSREQLSSMLHCKVETLEAIEQGKKSISTQMLLALYENLQLTPNETLLVPDAKEALTPKPHKYLVTMFITEAEDGSNKVSAK